MDKYRRRPEIIEALQYRPPALSLIDNTPGVCQCPEGSMRGHVHTRRKGVIVDVQPGDWIIRDGEHFDVCPEETFRASYEPLPAVLDEPDAEDIARAKRVMHEAVETHRAAGEVEAR